MLKLCDLSKKMHAQPGPQTLEGPLPKAPHFFWVASNLSPNTALHCLYYLCKFFTNGNPTVSLPASLSLRERKKRSHPSLSAQSPGGFFLIGKQKNMVVAETEKPCSNRAMRQAQGVDFKEEASFWSFFGVGFPKKRTTAGVLTLEMIHNFLLNC